MSLSGALGIDLGNTNLVAAGINAEGHTELLRDALGAIAMPCAVYFDDARAFVGEEALLRGQSHPDRLALNAKHDLGRPVVADALAACRPYPADDKPVFVGHYWLTGDTPALLAPNVACLDYSVAKKGLLCAYRWDGEQLLDTARFVCVRARAG